MILNEEINRIALLLDEAGYNLTEKNAILAVLPHIDAEAKNELLQDIEITKREFLDYKKKRITAEIEFLENFLQKRKSLEKQNYKDMAAAVENQKNNELKRKLDEI